ncbi:MAG: futalosine hydrolase [Niabella sp.]
MKGLLVAATPHEIAPIKQYLHKNTQWNVVITGIGGVATTYRLYKAIVAHKPDFLLQAGIGGAFSKKTMLGTVWAINSDCFGDLGVAENGSRKTLFDLKLMGRNEKPFKNGQLVNPYKKIIDSSLLPLANAVSVNEITTSRTDAVFYKNVLKADIESMEGAAFHYLALMENIPFLQIRSISNHVGERNKQLWKMKEAISNLENTIVELIQIL